MTWQVRRENQKERVLCTLHDKNVALLSEGRLKLREVFDDAVVDDRDVPAAVEMRMGGRSRT